MVYLRGIRTNERVCVDLETLPVGTVVEDFDGKRYTRDARRGWCDTEGHMISISSLEKVADWVIEGTRDSSIIYPSGYAELSVTVSVRG